MSLIEVLRSGKFTPTRGGEVSFLPADLKHIAASYDAASAPAPVVIGHPQTDAPAYGWAKSFSYDEQADRLLAELDKVEPSFAEAVSDGRYRKVSMALFEPSSSNNPRPGGWYAKHIGFLGAAAPAVSGLKPVQFSSTDLGVVTVEFAGLTAQEGAKTAQFSGRDSSFSAFMDLSKEDMCRAFSREIRSRENVAFVEKMVDQGRMQPQHIEGAVAFMNSLDIGLCKSAGHIPGLVVPEGYSVAQDEADLFEQIKRHAEINQTSFSEAVRNFSRNKS